MANRSVLITTVGRTLDGIDVDALAQESNLTAVRLSEHEADVSAVVSADLLSAGDSLIVGTGDYNYDADAASALGVPVLVVAAAEEVAELAKKRIDELGATVAAVVADVDAAAINTALTTETEQVMSAAVFENWLLNRAKEKRSHIVLPEGEDDRILEAADQLLAQDVADITILGDSDDIARRADSKGLNLSKANIIDHLNSELLEEFAADFAELRKKKGISIEEARETMKDISYFATMMVHKGLADGMVSGAAHTTAHTIKPSFQIIKTAPGATVVSSIFLMVMRGRLWAFGDCAVNPNPTAEQIGEIAAVSAQTAAQFGIDPKVAVLSYSTGTSGSGPDVDRAVEATAKAKELAPDVAIDGPLQFDAACDPGVGKKKAPDSPVAGEANVFIFPDLEAGNAGYKIAQRTAGALAVGPILQGLNKPVNDLSRGATVPDIVNTVAITAIQAQGAH
ncbi:phosphate acetyltransferase [Corynebacterium genitalium ATCC 33030]|uniref:Phosphate acetyltransferase n=1 Tax=Corynebacterium genitalium ATCC 33030 TaxID=585529 RepID=D7W9T9_9CORY|nr:MULTISPECIES: phosphate acetyltransferase [Corynebacterium]MCQ4619281.1 phosphate acetyltransferase [Corynebacterium pseudogenitalium]EFK55556.1 phosphate acetyltransferase [Corynebacterium genitalium ATCC 33030]MCQ4623647.1 phosphate acetyltransferase [Corynebacterium sp. CCUG 70398]MCQ4627362.1 phosphate acetyltransferase [Corynebacterium sp. CCUG 65737]UUA89216.1 phosphate acetyltransferase [Corynebacterium genitalium ATCC 33030]